MIREHLGAGNGKAIAGDDDVQNFQGLERRVVERSAVFRSDFKSYSREWAGTPVHCFAQGLMLLKRF